MFAVAVLATSFPFGSLLAQHKQLAAAAAQLSALRHENGVLAEQQRQLATNSELGRIAREDYQLVAPGQTLFDILPPAGAAGSTGAGGTSIGDPGSQPLVAPADAPNMTPDPGLPQTAPSGSGNSSGRAASGGSGSASGPGAGATGGSPSSFWSRVVNTLEFWK